MVENWQETLDASFRSIADRVGTHPRPMGSPSRYVVQAMGRDRIAHAVRFLLAETPATGDEIKEVLMRTLRGAADEVFLSEVDRIRFLNAKLIEMDATLDESLIVES